MDKEAVQKIIFPILKNCHEAVGLIREGKRSYEEALELLGALAMFNEDRSQDQVTIIPPPPSPEDAERCILVESSKPRGSNRENDDTVLLD